MRPFWLFPSIAHRLLQRGVWVALFAMLLNSGASTVTALVAQSRGETMAVYAHCLAMALEHEDTDQAALAYSDGRGPHHASRERKGVSCPFCYAHAGSFGLVPVAAVHEPSALFLGTEFLVETSAAPRFRSWLNPHLRDPPILS